MSNNMLQIVVSLVLGAFWAMLCSVAGVDAFSSIPSFLVVTIGTIMVGTIIFFLMDKD